MSKIQSVPLHALATLPSISVGSLGERNTRVCSYEPSAEVASRERANGANALHTPVLIVEKLSILQHKLTLSTRLTLLRADSTTFKNKPSSRQS